MSVADILVTPVIIYRAEIGTTEPSPDLPAGSDWANWTKMGLTSAPLTVNFTREKLKLMVEQVLGKVGTRITDEAFAVETQLAEFTLRNLAYSFPGTLTEYPATTGMVGYEELEGGGKICLDTVQWGFEGYTSVEECGKRFPLRLFIIGEAEAGGQLQFSKSAQTGIPFMVDASHDPDKPVGRQLYKWQRVTADKLSS